jgi:peptide/nickel transport system ATP-binding protein/oligopeptide transport system ATP-binding protein
MSAIPSLDPTAKSHRITLPGDVPSPAKVPSGCSFHPRCPQAMPVCASEEPPFRDIEPGHATSCWLYEDH